MPLCLLSHFVKELFLFVLAFFYNSFLPDVSERGSMGRVSGLGWGLGYLGGGLCLVLNLVMIDRPGWFGIPEGNHLPVRLSVCVAGIWWFVFAVPTFLWVGGETSGRRTPRQGSLAGGLRAVQRLTQSGHTCRPTPGFERDASAGYNRWDIIGGI